MAEDQEPTTAQATESEEVDLPAFEVPQIGTPEADEVELRLFCGKVAAQCTRGGMEPEQVLEQARKLHDWIAERDREIALDAMQICAELYKGQAARFLIQQAGLFYDYATSPIEPEPQIEPDPEQEPEQETEVETQTTNDASPNDGAGQGSESPATPAPAPPDPHESKARKPEARGRKKAGAAGRGQKAPPS